MIKRKSEELLNKLAMQFPVVAVIGPRQSGKTTLVLNSFPEKKYISFDDPRYRNLAKNNPYDFLAAFPEGLIIDEVQKVPEIFDVIKLFVDRGIFSPGKYILTGSSQFKLRENVSDSLAGRVAFLKLLPFSIEELRSASVLPDEPYAVFHKGFYPPLYDSTKSFAVDTWYQNYIDTYLDLDVKEHISVANIGTFKKFIQICAMYSGQIINCNKIALELGVSSVTIRNWFSILETSFIIHFVEPDLNNLGKQIIKSPKLYFVDSGLLCYLLRLETKEDLLLSDHKGAVVETVAVSELLKSRLNIGKRSNLTYFRDNNGFEVDVIADWTHSLAMEIKSSVETIKKSSAGVKKYIKLRGDDTKGKVLYTGDLTCNMDGIEYVSWKDWGKGE